MPRSTSPQPKQSAPSGNDRPFPKEEPPATLTEPATLIDRRVARRIRARRLRNGITLQTLAQDIGVAFQQAHKYERGQSRVSAGRLFHIARALGAPITYFFLPDEEANTVENSSAKESGLNGGERELPKPAQGPDFLGDRRGATAALFAVMLTALLGFAGLGIDVGIWYALQREYQS